MQPAARGDVLITGATGFLGKELLARLLEHTDRRVWALVRAADQAAARKRMRAILASLVASPEAVADRVVPVAGDLLLPELGLRPRQRDEIAEHVEEIIHSAASVSFGLTLDQARAVNVEGTQNVLGLATHVSARAGGLRRVAHVSTAYVAGTHRGLFGGRDLDRGQSFHNTYERSKWEAEHLVRRNAERLPVQVIRPSIVVGDEHTGWTDSFNVIYAPLSAYASGALRAVPARRAAPVDAVPVSYVAQAILALGGAQPGSTWNLAAGPAAGNVGELIDRCAELLGRRPVRTVPPALYRRAVHPLLVRRALPRQRRWLERGDAFFPYFDTGVRFDTAATRAALAPLGIDVPPLISYLDRLLAFASRAKWGRRPIGRAEARTFSSPRPGPEAPRLDTRPVVVSRMEKRLID
jgi:thioester reductase-like protein